VAVISPVLSALLNVDVTVSPLPTLTCITGRTMAFIVFTTRVSTTLNLIDWRLTLWYSVMLHISALVNPTRFIACRIFMDPFAPAMMPAARDNSSSTLPISSDMTTEEGCIVLAHFCQAKNDLQSVYTASVEFAPKWDDPGRCSRRHFDGQTSYKLTTNNNTGAL